MPDRYIVAGAGLAGSLMALFLGREGHNVEVYERRPDPRLAGHEGGRSINLAISERGLDAMGRAGLRDQVLAMAIPMRGRMIHGAAGELRFQPYGVHGQAINSVSRGGLNSLLLEAAGREAGVRLHFDQRCLEVDPEVGRAVFQHTRTEARTETSADAIIGADGAFSAVRAAMQRRDRFDYSQDYLAHGYKELYIPPAEGGGFRLEPNALHIWPRGGFMMIALPNPDGSFTCTLFWAFEGPNSFANLRSEADVLRYFSEVYPDAVPHMPTLAEDFFRNPTSSLVTVRCGPWTVGGRTALVGDACHAVVPFYGQGANAAFEDCVILDECLRQHPGDRARAFSRYHAIRKEHADALADLAIGNFIEMRDTVASPLFRLRKRVEKILHTLFPRWYLPLYTMISFSRIPYADAVRRARRQDRYVRWIMGAVILAALGAAWMLLRA